jgi:predicted nicotinamide N-methyase
MQYSAVRITVTPNLSLLIPDPDEVRNMYEAEMMKANQILFPYWTKIWPSAKALAKFLIEQPYWIQNKKIVELAAGIGLPSFTIAHIAQSVVVSDASTDAVKLLDFNIILNGLQNASALQIDWNNHPEPIPQTDTLLLSDVCFDPSQYDGLLKLLKAYKNQGTDIVISAPERMSTVPFHQLLSPLLKKTVLEKIDNTDIAIFIL